MHVLSGKNQDAESIVKQIIVLAVSFKHGGRCIAGREITFASGERPVFGQWVRPVSALATGELLPHHYLLDDGRPPHLLDVIEITVLRHQPDDLQPENWLLDESREPNWIARLRADEIADAVEDLKGIWLEPDRFTDRVSAHFLQDFPPFRSLTFLHVARAEITPDVRNGYRIGFEYCGERYRLKITDSGFEDRLALWLAGLDENSPLVLEHVMVCISLGLEFEGYHYKLAAGIVPARLNGPLFTIGHSNRSTEDFIRALRLHEVDAVADVRSQPASRRFPQFSQNALRVTLKEAGIQYVHLGDELGARRSESECYVGDQVQFELAAQTPAFQNGIRRLLSGSSRYTISLMCAERDPLDCHRTILVCRHLWQYGFAIQHIIDAGQFETHAEAEARLCVEEKVNPGQVGLFHESSEALNPLAYAYRLRASKIAYKEETGHNEDVYDRVYAEEG